MLESTFDGILVTLFVLMTLKFLTGIAASLKAVPREFKAFYVGRILRNEGVVFGIIVLLAFILSDHWTVYCYAGLFAFHLIAGIIKNIVHLNKRLGDHTPSVFREPTRLRLGNAKNLPN